MQIQFESFPEFVQYAVQSVIYSRRLKMEKTHFLQGDAYEYVAVTLAEKNPSELGDKYSDTETALHMVNHTLNQADVIHVCGTEFIRVVADAAKVKFPDRFPL